MIRTCENCGGLYATEHLEMFAGTPCRCGAKRRLIVAPPDVACSDWVAELEAVLRAVEKEGQEACKENDGTKWAKASRESQHLKNALRVVRSRSSNHD